MKTRIHVFSILITVLLLINAYHIGKADITQESQEQNSSIKRPYIFTLLNGSRVLSVTNTDNVSNTNFSIPVPSTITPEYVFVDLRASLLSATGLLSGKIVIAIADQNKSIDFSGYDFDPHGQVIFDFEDLEITSSTQISFILILESRSVFDRSLEYSLMLEGLDVYIITPPVYYPIIVPVIHRQIQSRLIFDLDDYITHFIMFLPQNQAFSVNITSTEKIKIKYLRIDDAEWVNVPSKFEFTNNQSLEFVTDDEDKYLTPKYVTLSITLYQGSSLTLYFSSQIIILESITYLPKLTSEETLMVYGINAGLIGIPLANLIKDRRKTVIKKT
ncbi:MAG: hypothetical protein HeimC3_12900 [Candidatus Heimdallarchaeota archaeon LC_3]|nr:MAG: hypothetical protein HeimC3_16050 [Candidatus Heimdallarchaeota archaeon LC_3]OLS26016.1 MAG: hypothetical protein HeimC3_12900 [Candidatus Heimdallarchaeota archaeon LC_3]